METKTHRGFTSHEDDWQVALENGNPRYFHDVNTNRGRDPY